MPSPFCLYSNAVKGVTTGCFIYYANEWMTFEVHVKIGSWYSNDKSYHRDSRVELYAAKAGQPLQYIVSAGHYDLANTSPATAKYGKVWLLPYHGSKDNTINHPVLYTWYDDLIISTQPIGLVPTPPEAPVIK